MVVEYIEENEQELGVEPICAVLEDAGVHIAPSAYCAAKIRPVSKGSPTGAVTTKKIVELHAGNSSVYGALKVWAELHRRGRGVARCTPAQRIADHGAEISPDPLRCAAAPRGGGGVLALRAVSG